MSIDLALKLSSLVPQFLQRAEARLAAARALLESDTAGDRTRLRQAERIAHDLAGSADMMGFGAIGDAARRLEHGIVAARRRPDGPSATDLAAFGRALASLQAMVTDGARR